MVLDHKTKYFECKLAFTNLLKATMKGKISQTLIVIDIKFIRYDMDHEHHHAHSYVTERNVQADRRKTDEKTF